MKKSKRSNVDPFIVMDVMESARKAEANGKHVIHMEVGQPGTPAPKRAKQFISDEISNNDLGYTVTLGLPELRNRISKLYGDWYNIDLNPDRIIITTGSSGAFILSFAALFDVGDRVGIAAPGYPSYRQILKSQDLIPIDIFTELQNKFQPIPKDIKENNLNGLLVASPANPTGSMLDKKKLEELINTAHENKVSFISDEIYHGIEYEKKAVTAKTIIIGKIKLIELGKKDVVLISKNEKSFDSKNSLLLSINSSKKLSRLADPPHHPSLRPTKFGSIFSTDQDSLLIIFSKTSYVEMCPK